MAHISVGRPLDYSVENRNGATASACPRTILAISITITMVTTTNTIALNPKPFIITLGIQIAQCR